MIYIAKMTRQRGNIPNKGEEGQIRLCEEINCYAIWGFIMSLFIPRYLVKMMMLPLDRRNSVFKTCSATFCYKFKTFQSGQPNKHF